MEGQDFSVFGIVEGKDDLVIVDEHRVQEDFDEPLLAVNVGVVHVCELVQKEPDVFLLQTQLLLQPGRRQSHPKLFLLLLQLVHTVLGAFVEDTGFDGPEEVGDGLLRFRQGGLEGIGIAGVRVLGDIVLIGAFRNELQKLLTANQIAQMLQHQMLDPVLPDGPLGTVEPVFIPSACWRKIARGILSTTRFAGVLAAHGKLYAVYDIGDGTMDWQLRAESSLFYHKYGSFETKADGMILVCEDGKRNEIAKQIIRQTMWGRKTLLKDRYAETDKPVRYSRSPIKLRAQYEHVYLTTPALLQTSLERIYGEEYHIQHAVKNSYRSHDPSQGDVEVYPNRYYLNPAFDLLKLVHFFATVKGDIEYEEDPDYPVIRRILAVHQEDLEVAGMYPDVKAWKGTKIHVYKSPQDA